MSERPPADDVPDYVVRISARARHMQLKVSPSARVEVVVPRGADHRLVPAFVAEHREWLRKTLTKLHQARADDRSLSDPRPRQVLLPAAAEAWQVEYGVGPTSRARSVSGAQAPTLRVGGPDGAAWRAALRAWLSRRARAVLLPWLDDLSVELGLPFEGVSVRAQKTRWGSCSARRHISLNRALLFLPAPVVRYLLVHELCHTVYMNHSRRYWQLVARCEPDYRALDARLGAAWREIPLWAYAE